MFSPVTIMYNLRSSCMMPGSDSSSCVKTVALLPGWTINHATFGWSETRVTISPFRFHWSETHCWSQSQKLMLGSVHITSTYIP